MFSRLNRNFRKYFGISRTEANGIQILIILMIFLMILPMLYRQFDRSGYNSYLADLVLLDSLAAEFFITPEMMAPDSSVSVVIEPSAFDPNQVTFSEMVSMGIDSVLSGRIVSYRNKGGRFVREKDLLRIYDFPQELFDTLRPFIRLPERTSGSKNREKENRDRRKDETARQRTEVPLHMDLNQADSAGLMRVRGIGPVLSGRIIRFRELLGGFVHPEQLAEVYGLKDEALVNLKSAVYIDSLFVPVKLRVNFAEWQDLVKHPYISSDLANSILYDRSSGGPYRNASQLSGRLALPDSLVEKLVPYLKF